MKKRNARTSTQTKIWLRVNVTNMQYLMFTNHRNASHILKYIQKFVLSHSHNSFILFNYYDFLLILHEHTTETSEKFSHFNASKMLKPNWKVLI